MTEEKAPYITEDQKAEILRAGRERTRRSRARAKEKQEAERRLEMGLVDCPIEITNAEARQILIKERGFKNLHVVE